MIFGTRMKPRIYVDWGQDLIQPRVLAADAMSAS
jgi:hypothetical protein